jgi:hypothetical protein
MQYQTDFERALTAKDPIAALRKLALRLHSEGNERQAIYDIFLEFYQSLRDNERRLEEDQLGDVMDMIADQFAPFNLNLPGDEPAR